MPKPIKLSHDLDGDDLTCRAVIETPKGSRSKFDYDTESGLFLLAGLVPEGMTFPLNFGFIPSTKGEDGDPLDVMVLHDESIPVGALIDVRLLGVIEGDQTEDGNTVRNDRLLAVTTCSHQYQPIRHIDQLGKTFLDHLTQFWVNYNALKGKRFEVRGVHGPKRAREAIKKASKH
ncbi:MAG: inorganic pyrophosphatase [Methylobacteriaceae bacterium]|nr:inorganic pyrophosphatase [Methylobacteriaceae bacterium]